MGKWDQQFIHTLMKSRDLTFEISGDNNKKNKKRESKAASLSSFFATEINKAQLIKDIIFS